MLRPPPATSSPEIGRSAVRPHPWPPPKAAGQKHPDLRLCRSIAPPGRGWRVAVSGRQKPRLTARCSTRCRHDISSSRDRMASGAAHALMLVTGPGVFGPVFGRGAGRATGVPLSGRTNVTDSPTRTSAVVKPRPTAHGALPAWIYDEAWRLMRQPALLARMQSQWKLSRGLGIANLLIVHRLSDLDAVGEAGSEARALARGLLADCSTSSSTSRRSPSRPTPPANLDCQWLSARSCLISSAARVCGASASEPSSSDTSQRLMSFHCSTPTPACRRPE